MSSDLQITILKALGELGNMMLGSVANELYQQGVMINISPPTVIVSESIGVTSPIPTLCVPMYIDDLGALDVHVSLTD